MVRTLTDVLQNGSNGSPWWVKVIYNLGIPAASFVFLLWFVTSTLAGNLEALANQSAKIETQQGVILANQQSIMDNLRLDLERQRESCYLMRQVCLNTAKDATQRSACIAFDRRIP